MYFGLVEAQPDRAGVVERVWLHAFSTDTGHAAWHKCITNEPVGSLA